MKIHSTFKILIWAILLMMISTLCKLNIWAVDNNPSTPPPTINVSPNVVLQTSPQALEQINNFFNHADYHDFQHYPILPLFEIPNGQP